MTEITKTGKIRIGISGWRYKPWRGSFYPEGLPQRQELAYASQRLNSIELNGSFYALQTPDSFARWHDETPDDFVFSIKGSRYITHMLKLRGAEQPMANFFAQGLLRLGNKLGPILWQLPPILKFDAERLEAFLSILPRTHREAAEMAHGHDSRMEGRSWLKVARNRRLSHAIEIRNESFVSEEFVALLRKYRVALVKADTVEWPLLMDGTSDFVYCRLHGSEELYASGYEDAALDVWADRLVQWSRGGEVTDGRHASAKAQPPKDGRDVFVYFDNDIKVRAPFDAQNLASKVARSDRSLRPVKD